MDICIEAHGLSPVRPGSEPRVQADVYIIESYTELFFKVLPYTKQPTLSKKVYQFIIEVLSVFIEIQYIDDVTRICTVSLFEGEDGLFRCILGNPLVVPFITDLKTVVFG
ncbi:MAG: hypothetical protein QF415_04035 [Candidatus Undinarchaeales archaeon]|nr:hypothetical protein [Candidatus Undinarchaeales archaeon]